MLPTNDAILSNIIVFRLRYVRSHHVHECTDHHSLFTIYCLECVFIILLVKLTVSPYVRSTPHTPKSTRQLFYYYYRYYYYYYYFLITNRSCDINWASLVAISIIHNNECVYILSAESWTMAGTLTPSGDWDIRLVRRVKRKRKLIINVYRKYIGLCALMETSDTLRRVTQGWTLVGAWGGYWRASGYRLDVIMQSPGRQTNYQTAILFRAAPRLCYFSTHVSFFHDYRSLVIPPFCVDVP